jgi:hypothetical protein
MALVIELQKAAMDKGASVSDLLRRTKVVAVKLRLTDIAEWVNHELSGYPDGVDIPEYREIQGEIRGLNPYHGWQPVFGDEEHLNIARTMKTTQSISVLEALVAGSEDNLYFRVRESFRARIQYATDVRCFVSRSLSGFCSLACGTIQA